MERAVAVIVRRLEQSHFWIFVGLLSFREKGNATVHDMAATCDAVSDSEVRRFVDDGYLVKASLVEPEFVEAIRVDAIRFAEGHYPVSNMPEDRRILAIHFPHWVSDVALAAVKHPGISSVVSAIAGAHLAHWDGRVKCMQSMLFLKPPGLQTSQGR